MAGEAMLCVWCPTPTTPEVRYCPTCGHEPNRPGLYCSCARCEASAPAPRDHAQVSAIYAATMRDLGLTAEDQRRARDGEEG